MKIKSWIEGIGQDGRLQLGQDALLCLQVELITKVAPDMMKEIFFKPESKSIDVAPEKICLASFMSGIGKAQAQFSLTPKSPGRASLSVNLYHDQRVLWQDSHSFRIMNECRDDFKLVCL